MQADGSGVAYQATKRGLVGLAHGAMVEERANGIRTTVIFPGLTDTPLILKRPVPTPPEVLAKALQPEDIAQACLFVATLPPRAHVPELTIVPRRPDPGPRSLKRSGPSRAAHRSRTQDGGWPGRSAMPAAGSDFA